MNNDYLKKHFKSGTKLTKKIKDFIYSNEYEIKQKELDLFYLCYSNECIYECNHYNLILTEILTMFRYKNRLVQNIRILKNENKNDSQYQQFLKNQISVKFENK